MIRSLFSILAGKVFFLTGFWRDSSSRICCVAWELLQALPTLRKQIKQLEAIMVDLVVMSKDGVLEDRGRDSVTVQGMKQVGNEGEGEQLLPGIPDEITIAKIAAKLPWTAFYILSSVSRGWQRAIRSRQVYDSRVRSKSTQTLLPFDQWTSIGHSIVLYCVEDRSCHHLPQIPGVHRGKPVVCQSISLDGRLYILGGQKDFSTEARADVYVFDLVGQRHWKQCASMKDARLMFGCGVQDGKIYVFGGQSAKYPVCGSEVYDPKEDVWSSITSIPSSRMSYQVTTLGEELFVHNGYFYDLEIIRSGVDYQNNLQYATCAEVYHPQRNEWRIVEHFTRSCWDKVLMVGGNFYRLNKAGIEIYDIHANSWGPPHPISFGKAGPSRFGTHWVTAVVVEDEVLAMVRRRMRFEEDESDGSDEEDEVDEEDPKGAWLIRSQGTGGKEIQVPWRMLPVIISQGSSPMRPIQL